MAGLISRVGAAPASDIKIKRVSGNVRTNGAPTSFSSFFPAHCVPLALKIKVTTAIGNNGYITDVGTDGDADLFTNALGDGVLEEEDDELTTGHWFPLGTSRSAFMNADTDLYLTHANTPDAGAVQVSMVYIDGANI